MVGSKAHWTGDSLPLGDLSSAAIYKAEPHPAAPQAWEAQALPTESETSAHTSWTKGGQGEKGLQSTAT